MASTTVDGRKLGFWVPLLLAVALTGFFVRAVDGWGLWYRINLAVHPLLGIVASLVALVMAVRRLRVRIGIARALAACAPALLVIVAAMPSASLHSPVDTVALSAVLFAAFGLGFIWLRAQIPQSSRVPVLLSYAGLALWWIALWSGLAILRVFQDGGVKHLFLIHGALAVAAMLPFVAHLVIPLVAPLAKIKGLDDLEGMARRSRSSWAWTIAAIVVAVAVVGADRWFQDPRFTIHLSTIPLEARDPGARQVHFDQTDFAPAALDLTRSCTQTTGCHGPLERGFLESNHNIAYHTPHFQKNLDALTKEIGFENTLICAGCHTPLSLFDRSKDYRYFKDHNNLSCSFCHMIGDVQVTNDDPRRSSYTLEPPVRHLALFMRDGREVVPDAWTAAAIRLSPLNHGRAFRRELYGRDEYCLVCHHHQLRVPIVEGIARPRCVDCHMQAQSQLGMEGEGRSHFMPGANLVVPTFAGQQAAATRTRKWLNGDYLLFINGWENAWEPRTAGGENPSRAMWLYLLLESDDEPEAGREFAFHIRTSNVGMEHQFPAAALDLTEVWLDVTVKDSTDRILFRSGEVGSDGNLAPDAHTMGGYMIGMDEKIVTKNRVWQVKRKVVQRILWPGHQTVDDFAFVVPAEARGPLSIQAAWRYRKLSQDFVAWAYGPGVVPPEVTLGSLATNLPLGTPPELEIGAVQ
jgi:hypothetical protein